MFQIVEKGNINKQGKRMAEFFHSSAQQMQQILCTVNILTECLKKPKQGVPQAFFLTTGLSCKLKLVAAFTNLPEVSSVSLLSSALSLHCTFEDARCLCKLESFHNKTL